MDLIWMNKHMSKILMNSSVDAEKVIIIGSTDLNKTHMSCK